MNNRLSESDTLFAKNIAFQLAKWQRENPEFVGFKPFWYFEGSLLHRSRRTVRRFVPAIMEHVRKLGVLDAHDSGGIDVYLGPYIVSSAGGTNGVPEREVPLEWNKKVKHCAARMREHIKAVPVETAQVTEQDLRKVWGAAKIAKQYWKQFMKQVLEGVGLEGWKFKDGGIVRR